MAGLSVIFKAVDEISGRFESMANAGRSVMSAFEEIEESANAAFSNIDQGTEKVSASVDRTADELKRYSDRMEAAAEAAGYHYNASGRLVDVNGRFVASVDAAAGKLDTMLPKLKAASRGVDAFGEESSEAGRQAEGFGESAASAIASIGTLLAATGIIYGLKEVAQAFKDCSHEAAEFETGIAKLSTIADTNALSMGQMEGQIGALSKDMARDVGEITESSYNAISAGVDTADSVAMVGEATKLSEAGFTSVSSSLSILTTGLNAYQLEASKAGKISDSLVMTQNLGVLTIDQLSGSIGKAISTASAYSINLYNLESGYVSLTKAGISVEESTTYLSSMFNELGSAGTEVADILLEATGRSFGQLMRDGYSLADVLGILYDSVGRDSEALMNLWGSAEAGKASNAIVNQGLEIFDQNLQKLSNSAGATQTAYETMTATTEFSTRRLENSFKNLSIAFGADLNPVIRNLQNGISDVADGFTSLIQRHPAISAVLTGLVVGFGAVTAAVTALSAAFGMVSLVSSVFASTLGVSLSTVLLPLSLVAGGIAAVTAGVIYWNDKMEDVTDVEDHLVISSQKMSDELDSLKKQYAEEVEANGKRSDKAYALAEQIDSLTESYQANKITIGELAAEIESLGAAIEEIDQTYEEAITSNGQLEYHSKSLVAQLAVLSSRSSHTNADFMIMQKAVDELNGSYDGLGLTLDKTTGKLNVSTEDLYAAVKRSADEANKQAAADGLMDAVQNFSELDAKMQLAKEDSVAAWKNYSDLEAQWKTDHPWKAAIAGSNAVNWSAELTTAFRGYQRLNEEALNAGEAYGRCVDEIEKFGEALGLSSEEIDAIIEGMREAGSEAANMGNEMANGAGMFGGEDWLGAAQEAVDAVKPGLEELKGSYDAAYTAARSSIEGQIGLFETMKTECSLSTDDMLKAFDSQIEYLNNYAENIQKAQEYGLDADLIAKLSDGSAESAAQIEAIIGKVEELGATTEEAQNFIGDFNTKFEEVNTAKDTFSNAVADMQTGFSKGMEKILGDLTSTIKGMDMSSEATKSANATIEAYIGRIRSGVGEINTELSKIKIPSLGGGGGGSGVPGKATGTSDARPGLTLVGETGPELVVFGGGETVYTATETDNILSRGRSADDLFIAPPVQEPAAGAGERGGRTIVLKLEGAGELRIDKGASKNEVVNWMMENMRDVLLGIVQQEILEEGDMAYEF